MDEDRLPAPLIGALAEHGNTRPFRPNTILITEGDAGDSLYIVLTGRLRAYAAPRTAATSSSANTARGNTSASCRSTAGRARPR